MVIQLGAVSPLYSASIAHQHGSIASDDPRLQCIQVLHFENFTSLTCWEEIFTNRLRHYRGTGSGIDGDWHYYMRGICVMQRIVAVVMGNMSVQCK